MQSSYLWAKSTWPPSPTWETPFAVWGWTCHVHELYFPGTSWTGEWDDVLLNAAWEFYINCVSCNALLCVCFVFVRVCYRWQPRTDSVAVDSSVYFFSGLEERETMMRPLGTFPPSWPGSWGIYIVFSAGGSQLTKPRFQTAFARAINKYSPEVWEVLIFSQNKKT